MKLNKNYNSPDLHKVVGYFNEENRIHDKMIRNIQDRLVLLTKVVKLQTKVIFAILVLLVISIIIKTNH